MRSSPQVAALREPHFGVAYDSVMSVQAHHVKPVESLGALSRPIQPMRPRRRTRRRDRVVEYVGLAYVFSTPLDLISLPVRSPTTILGALLIALWLVRSIRRGGQLPKHGWAIGLGLLFVAWASLTSAWSVVPDVSVSQAISTAMLLLAAIAIGSVFGTRLQRPAWALLLGSLVLAGSTLLIGGQQVYYVQGAAQVSAQYTFSDIDQNALSLHLVLGCAAALFLLRRRATLVGRLLLLVMVGVLVATVLLVGSRSAIGSLIGMALLMVIMSGKRVSALLWTAITVAVALLPIKMVADAGLIPERVTSWLMNPVVNDSRSEIIGLYRDTMGDWFWTGVGTGGDAYYLQAVASTYLNAHSAFWKIWIETGIVGLCLWLGFLVATAGIALRSPDRDFFLLSGLSIVVYFYTLGPVNSNMVWAIFGLALGMPALVRDSSSLHRGPAPSVNREDSFRGQAGRVRQPTAGM